MICHIVTFEAHFKKHKRLQIQYLENVAS